MSDTHRDSKDDEPNKKPHCMHFVTRKKRFCRMTVKSGLSYCGEHEPKTEACNTSSNSRLRIPCPLDSKHTCFAVNLQKHLKKCNAKLDNTIPYLKKNVNVEQIHDKKTDRKNRHLVNVPVKKILEVIRKVNKVYADFVEDSVSEKVLHHETLADELQKEEYGPTTRKHLLQASSLLGHLKQSNLFQQDTCFVEFGAGKGQLSFWIAKAASNIADVSIVLVERASLRHKLDNKLDKQENNICRIRADIADLVLSEVEAIRKRKNIIGVTKHLCGEATDLALRCLMNTTNTNLKITGIVMAFCCHHRCFWSSYTGKKFFQVH